MRAYFSPAKINLFFRVLGKRSDGYHEIASLYQAIHLCDEIHLSFYKEDCFSCSDPQLKWDENNLIFKAIHLFREKTGYIDPVAIDLNKQIPIGGGLGGGSSNAATILFAMNQLYSYPLSLSELKGIGLKIGADVPFFFSSGTAYCTGIGEKIEEMSMPYMEPLYLVVPPFPMSTLKVYQNCKPNECSAQDPKQILAQFYSTSPVMVNDLEPSAFRLDQRLSEIKAMLLNHGSACMTGSGSSFVIKGELPTTLSRDIRVFPISCLNRDIQNNQWFIAKK